MKNNSALYNEYIHEYTDYKLYPAEHIIIGRFQEKWSDFRMLDIGIGTGRTTHSFAPLTKQYTGIDYAENMLNQCQKILPLTNSSDLFHCDARDLSRFYDQSFDFVMFSLNGIDSVDHSDRIKILAEVRKVISQDGHFFFSTHSLLGFGHSRPKPKFKWYSPVKSFYHIYHNQKFNRRIQTLYPESSLFKIRKNNWEILKTGAHDFKMDIYHINPVYQIQQLDNAGFQVISTYCLHGGIEDVETTQANTLYYLCKVKQ